MIALAAGCSRAQDSGAVERASVGAGRPAATPGEEVAVIEMTRDPAALVAAREQAAQALAARRRGILDHFAELVWVDTAMREALLGDRAGSLARLRAFADDETAGVGTRLLAARTRLEMGDAGGWDGYLSLLREGTVEERVEALESMGREGLGRGVVVPSGGAFQRAVVTLLDDPHPEVAAAAVYLALDLDPGALPRALRAAAALPPEPSLVVLRSLVMQAPTPEVVTSLAGLVGKVPADRLRSTVFLALVGDDEATRSPAAALLERLLRDEVKAGGAPAQQEILAFLDHAPASALDLVEGWTATADLSVRRAAIEALARLRGEAVRPRLDAWLADAEIADGAASGLAGLEPESGDAALVARIEKAAGSIRYSHQPRAYTAALLRVGGPAAEAAARRVAERSMEPSERATFLAELDGRTLAQLVRGAVDAGLLSTAEAARATAEQRTSGDRTAPVQEQLLELLEMAGILTRTGLETDEMPVRHDLLLRDLATRSRGGFQALAAHETWVRPATAAPTTASAEQGEEDLEEALAADGPQEGEGHYLVQFIEGDRLYRFRCRDLGDWYDAERLVAAANRALADDGRRERFVELATGGDAIALLYADPAVVERAAAAGVFALPTSSPGR